MSGSAFYKSAPDGDLLVSTEAMAVLFDRPADEVRQLVRSNPQAVQGGAVLASRADIPEEWLRNARRRFREGAAATGTTDFAAIVDHLRGPS